MFFDNVFCDLQPPRALTGLTELQEYCGVLLSSVFDSRSAFPPDSHRCQLRTATGLYKKASDVYATARRGELGSLTDGPTSFR